MNLDVQNLSFSYHKKAVLKDVSFTLKPGQFLSVLGANGAGKSTLFRCILGALSSYGGTISIDGENVRTLTQRELAKRIAYIPQTHTAAFDFRVLDIVLMGTARQIAAFSAPSSKQIDAAYAALKRLGIESFAERSFAKISGGEQQLVMIARALAQQANILLMDEPTSNLDYGNQLRVLQQVRILADEGYAVLLSTHNPQHALTFSTGILALSGGRIAACGAPSDVLTPKLMQTLYQIDSSFEHVGARTVILPNI